MKIHGNPENVIKLDMFNQLDDPVAITAPLIWEDRVLIGVYCQTTGSSCIEVSVPEFQDLKSFLYDPKWFRLVVHGIKRIWEDYHVGSLDTNTGAVADTELMAWMWDSGRPEHEYSLTHLAHKYLDTNYPHQAPRMFEMGSPDALYKILTDDAYLIAHLGSVLLNQIDDDLKWLYFYGELPVALILNDMTRHGIPVNGQAAAKELTKGLAQMTALADQITGGQEHNLWDGSHVYHLLKEQKASVQGRSVHSAREVTHNELKLMARHNPLAAKILEWRDLHTDLAFLKMAAGKDRIHPTWNMMTRTSRITASNPAVQNVSKEKCRPLMRPKPGWVMIKADYKQIQMRILANISGDPELVRAFKEGKDVHWLTVEMCGIQGTSNKEKRDKAKAVNFGILFQMTADGLSRELGIDRKAAQGYIDAFWSMYTVAKQYLDGIVGELREKRPEERMIKSYLGRTRRFDGPFGQREQRQAKATLLQQMEAEILKMAMMRLQRSFVRSGMRSRSVMTIHDAVYVEAPGDEAARARRILKEQMETAVEMPLVPLEVDIE
jgi:DNA polymerase-1